MTVRVPSVPSDDVTEVGSTSSGSWHLCVKVFMTEPSCANCKLEYDLVHCDREDAYCDKRCVHCTVLCVKPHRRFKGNTNIDLKTYGSK